MPHIINACGLFPAVHCHQHAVMMELLFRMEDVGKKQTHLVNHFYSRFFTKLHISFSSLFTLKLK